MFCHLFQLAMQFIWIKHVTTWKAVEVHKVWATRMAALWWFESFPLMLGLQGGYRKYCCFLCEWNSRCRESHYVKKFWPQQNSWELEKKNVQHPPLVDSQKMLLPPFHIKLGLMKNFVKTLDKKAGFKYLYEKCPRLSEAKIKEGVFVGPQILELLRDDTFDHLLHGKLFGQLQQNFLETTKQIIMSSWWQTSVSSTNPLAAICHWRYIFCIPI